MKNKQSYLTKGSFALLLFVILGYVVKFYPENLIGFDASIQTAIRGDLPQLLTTILSALTSVFNPVVLTVWVLLLAAFFLYKKWKAEALLLVGNLVLAGLVPFVLKPVYQRQRPAIIHLVKENGFSFPSAHSLAATLILASLIIIVQQRLQNKRLRLLLQALLASLIFIILLSRVYLGVHYPTDVLAGLLLGFAIINIEFPFYDKLRFQWRFKSKQK
ncbi:phosphatase PAP2 family protein [Streptococcus massiliensis]|uniref:PAP2 family protein n=1 Tax=Streptococcus massiliensis TaxID=313439 RepID=A0A380KZK4_9STRE|nr:phosphatase PAP2 family protein [Streptococcus massiliensis]SUN76729.1 PAP2 family protein [Streptococcus massiliensis]